MLRFFATPLAVATLSVATILPAQCLPPAGYYASIDTRSSVDLRRTLHARIENHQRVPWNGTWAVLERADQDPNDPGRILDVYRNASYPKAGRGNANYDREHIWPKSLGYARSSTQNYPESDCHALFLCDSSYNTARSNKMFRNLERTSREYGTQNGGLGSYPGNSCWTSGFGVWGAWEAWVGRRGDVARAILYMDVRYDGSPHHGGATEPDLIVTDDAHRIIASQSTTNASVAYMGLLSVLLQWHQQDPPDSKECRHNDEVFRAQGNRNPFIDHPEWAMLLFVGAGRDARTAWINEFHYDNSGSDRDEMVEIAGPAGLDLDGWRLLGYNGNGGGVYDTVLLQGTIRAPTGCTGTLAFDFPRLQNGPNDGLALVDPRNRVIEFLSYEGPLLATDGAAVDLFAVDVGVSESSSTPVGHSLQRRGSGMLGSDFAWAVPSPNTRGRVNAQQSFVSGCGELEIYGCGLNPFGSIAIQRGLPSIGSTFAVGIHNPLRTQAGGSSAVFAVSPVAPIGFPCGMALPGFSMRSVADSGEFLLGANPLVMSAPLWNRAPSIVSLQVPNQANFVGMVLFAQGAILSPGAANGITVGLTDGLRIRVGQ